MGTANKQYLQRIWNILDSQSSLTIVIYYIIGLGAGAFRCARRLFYLNPSKCE